MAGSAPAIAVAFRRRDRFRSRHSTVYSITSSAMSSNGAAIASSTLAVPRLITRTGRHSTSHRPMEHSEQPALFRFVQQPTLNVRVVRLSCNNAGKVLNNWGSWDKIDRGVLGGRRENLCSCHMQLDQ